eukprot:gene27053-biopygen24359
MVASTLLPEPVLVDRIIAEANKKLIGPRFKLDQKKVVQAIETLDGEALEQFKAQIQAEGQATVDGFLITADLVTFKSEKKTVLERKFTPSVIEPSYGVGRIIYSVLEHAFSQRDGDEQRCVMSFRPCVSPIKLGLFRLLNNPAFDPIISSIKESMQRANLSSRVDSSS